MDTRFQKWVTLSYVAVAGLVAYILLSAGIRAVGMFDLETRIRNVELVARVASVVIGLIVFIVLYRHPKVNTYMNEVMVEMSRVAWPTQK